MSKLLLRNGKPENLATLKLDSRISAAVKLGAEVSDFDTSAIPPGNMVSEPLGISNDYQRRSDTQLHTGDKNPNHHSEKFFGFRNKGSKLADCSPSCCACMTSRTDGSRQRNLIIVRSIQKTEKKWQVGTPVIRFYNASSGACFAHVTFSSAFSYPYTTRCDVIPIATADLMTQPRLCRTLNHSARTS
jgi:hypothetical protein